MTASDFVLPSSRGCAPRPQGSPPDPTALPLTPNAKGRLAWVWVLAFAAFGLAPNAAFADARSSNGHSVAAGSRLRVIELSGYARRDAAKLTEQALSALRERIIAEPKQREARFELVTALQRAGKLDDAVREARAWRAVDAYNLVVVRLLGDLLSEQGKPEEALRVYSAVVELLAEDPEAQRALATVLQQSGQLAAARERLQAAHELRPEDARISFELADVAQRLGDHAAAKALFSRIASDAAIPQQIAYPARQRLGQVLTAERRDAKVRGDASSVERLTREIAALEIKGGVDNDIKIYLSWDTNRTDVDLWVLTPSRESIAYNYKQGRFGDALFDDVTSGYGPESFTSKHAQTGTYEVQVKFFGTSRQTFSEARGEVTVIVNEGSENERRHVIGYRLDKPGQSVSVAKIEVSGQAQPVAQRGGVK